MSPLSVPTSVQHLLADLPLRESSDPGEMRQYSADDLLDHYRPWLRSLALAEIPRALGPRIDASDVVQETLLEIARDLPAFRGTTRVELEGWMLQTLRHQIQDATRYHCRQCRAVGREQSGTPLQQLPSSVPTGSAVLRREESRSRLAQTLEQLPDDYRTVILLRQQLDLTFAEIGERMNRSADAARMLWGRAILRLSDLLPED